MATTASRTAQLPPDYAAWLGNQLAHDAVARVDMRHGPSLTDPQWERIEALLSGQFAAHLAAVEWPGELLGTPPRLPDGTRPDEPVDDAHAS